MGSLCIFQFSGNYIGDCHGLLLPNIILHVWYQSCQPVDRSVTKTVVSRSCKADIEILYIFIYILENIFIKKLNKISTVICPC